MSHTPRLLLLAVALLLAPRGAPAAPRRPPPTPDEIARLPPDGGPTFNRLVFEASPYLLQHCRNPVDWYPWGPEAFERARREDKPVFLSVGYSTCHWCHVMEAESFEDPEVARLLNERYVAVKVDREERPDIDELYMNATQLFTGQGGWPNSVWLDADQVPFFCATYLPRVQYLKRLTSLADAWRNDRGSVGRNLERFAQMLGTIAQGKGLGEAETQLEAPMGMELARAVAQALGQRFDATHGGFGGAPKFPPHQTLALFLELHRVDGDEERLQQVTRTLDAMVLGGIHDHVGGGFHRYSTDERWFLPHFEKMLPDNALLGEALTEAWRRTGAARYREAAEALYEWVLRDMTAPATGGFYSALDADVDGEEGRVYLWTPEEVVAALGVEEATLFGPVYRIAPEGNVRHQAGGPGGRSLPHRTVPLAATASEFRVPESLLRAQLARNRDTMRRVRDLRPQPARDDKVLSDWNALMIGSLARAGSAFAQPRYLVAATRAATFLLDRLTVDGHLMHRFRAHAPGASTGRVDIPGFLEDHAYLAGALLDLHQATGEERWLARARQLAETMVAEFRDPVDGGFFRTAARHERLLTRSKDPLDTALPSGGARAAEVLVRLYRITREARFRDLAGQTLEVAAPILRRAPLGAAGLARALVSWSEVEPRPEATLGTATLRARPVTLAARVEPPVAAAGRAVQVHLTLTVDAGWHVNTHAPTQDYLVPTQLGSTRSSAIRLGPVVYPKPVVRRVSFVSETLQLWEGSTSMLASGTVPQDTPPGEAQAVLELTYQACSATACLPPETHRLPVPIQVQAP